MKKKVLFVVILAAFACTGIWQANRADNNAGLSELATKNVEALATKVAESACPNGCVEGDDGCFCNGWHKYNEAG